MAIGHKGLDIYVYIYIYYRKLLAAV